MFKYNKQLAIMSLLLSIALSSCASIISGGKSRIQVTSAPSNLALEITDEEKDNKVIFSGTTPAEVELKKGSGFFKGASYNIEVSQAGINPLNISVSATDVRIGSYIIGNLFSAGLLGWVIVDPITGAMYKWSPARIVNTNSNSIVTSKLKDRKNNTIHIEYKEVTQSMLNSGSYELIAVSE